jgi:hypothetical protein
MKKIFLLLVLFSFHARAQFTNIIIDDGSTATFMFPSEPTIAVNPKNPDQLVAGANIARVYHSADGGITWIYDTLNSSLGVYGDPCTVVDTFGNFFYTHLASSGTQVICQRSADAGNSWSNGTLPAFIPGVWADKEWACVDWSNSIWRNSIYLTWTELADSLRILFSKSIDTGQTWSMPVTISSGTVNLNPWPDGNIGAVPATGPNGEVYVAWSARSIRFNKSTDAGATWLADPLYVDSIIPGWRYDSISGVSREQAFPSLACDISGGMYNGNIYISWADQRNGTSNTDVFMSTSGDGGNTWNTMRVNTDLTTSHQFMPWLCVDQSTGYIYVVYYDRSNYADQTTDVYLSWSTNGGGSFSSAKITALSFFPPDMHGDYIGIAASNNMIHPVWMQENTSVHSIWTAYIDYAQLDSITAVPVLASTGYVLKQNYPNPFSGKTFFDFFIPIPGKVTLVLYDVMGNTIEKYLDNEPGNAGWHHREIDAEEINLSTGVYSLKLQAGNFTAIRKMIVAR